MEMFEGFDSKPSFKRDIAHVFDAVSSYLAKKTKKVKQNTIRIYIGYDTSTGSMGHFSIVQAGLVCSVLNVLFKLNRKFNLDSNRRSSTICERLEY